MADINLKTLADIPVVEPNESTHLLAEQDGAYTRVPKDAVGGSNIPMTRGLKKYTYDGNSTGRETITLGDMSFVRVMDDALSADDFIGGKCELQSPNSIYTIDITSADVVEMTDGLACVGMGGMPFILLASQDISDFNGVSLKKGVYVFDDGDAGRLGCFTYYGEIISESAIPVSVLDKRGVLKFWINAKGSTLMPEMTFAEIYSAWVRGELPVATDSSRGILPLTFISSEKACFSSVQLDGTTWRIWALVINADDTAAFTSKEI